MATKASERPVTPEPANAVQNAHQQTPPVRKVRKELTPEQKAARKAMLAAESKQDRFRRLANRRVTKALSVLNHVRALTNKNQYEYTQEQGAKIVQALLTQVGLIRAGFEGAAKEKQAFTV